MYSRNPTAENKDSLVCCSRQYEKDVKKKFRAFQKDIVGKIQDLKIKILDHIGIH